MFKNNRITIACARLLIYFLIKDNETPRSLSGLGTKLCLDALFRDVQKNNKKSSITHCPTVQNLKRAAEHLFLVSVYSRPTLLHYKLQKSRQNPAIASILCSRCSETRVHACSLGCQLRSSRSPLPLKKNKQKKEERSLPFPRVSTGVNTPGETNRWMK